MNILKRCQKVSLLLAALLLGTSGTQAQLPINISTPFDVLGFIQAATLDPSCAGTDVFCGGTVTLNGHVITVPRNTILQMPAFALTWAEVFALAPPEYKALGQSGLALSDTPKPLTTYEIHVVGNRLRTFTGDMYIAGLVFISQQSLNTGQGFISFIDYAKGELRVGGVIGDATTGARVQLNDPATGRGANPTSGEFGIAHSPDSRFRVDQDNPTVHSATGYPMCIPRLGPPAIDPLCPQTNRPKDAAGNYLTVFTFPAPGLGVTPDVTQQAPFEIGDYVTFAGSLFADAQGQFISAFNVEAEAGIFTYPGTMPAYVFIETARIGTGGVADPLIPQEALDKIFVVGFSTDPTQLMDLWAVDVNPCSGNTTDRYYETRDPIGPPVGAFPGRVVYRTTIGNFLPPTRDMRLTSRTLPFDQRLGLVPVQTYANGLLAGQYRAPTFEFIFPERRFLGGVQPPANFQDFQFLAAGSGPYAPVSADGLSPAPFAAQAGQVVRQLSPWPGVSAPTTGCTGFTISLPPIPHAGANQTVNSESQVTLDGSASVDPNTPPLPLVDGDFTWIQVAGAPVVLSNSFAAKPTFKAPKVAGATQLVFQMAVTNGISSSSITSVTITVLPPGSPPGKDRVTIASAIWRQSKSRLVVTAATSDAVDWNNGTVQLTVTWPGNVTPRAMVNCAQFPTVCVPPVAAGQFLLDTVGIVPAPFSVTVVSSRGGTATSAVTRRIN